MKTKNLIAALLFAAGSAFAQVPPYVPTNGLVGWWPFNGNANDESGNGNNGTVNGATLTIDRFGNANSAYSFDELDDYINTTSNFYNPGLDHSISIWFLLADSLNVNNALFNTNPHRFESVSLNSYLLNPPVGVGYCLGDGVNWPMCGSNYGFNPQFNKANWSNLIVTKTSSDYRFYLNSVLVHTQSNVTFIPNLQINMWFGAISGGSNPPNEEFYGSLDDIGIWNRALSPTEVQQLYQNQSPCTLTSNFFSTDTISGCGNLITLNAGNAGAAYNWNTGATTQTINVNTTGWYKCTVNQGVCTATDSVFVSLVNAEIVQNDTSTCASINILLQVSSYNGLPNCSGNQTIRNVPASYSSIQNAINNSNNGDIILIQPGTYIENNLTFNQKIVHLVSAGDQNNTFLSGSGSNRLLTITNDTSCLQVIQGISFINGSALNNSGWVTNVSSG